MTCRLMSKQWCGGRPSENVAARDEDPAAVKHTFKEILFITDRDQKGIQLSDPEDLQGYLAYLACQVMEKLDHLAHLAHQAHQAPLQYMAQVRECDFAFHCTCECIGTHSHPPTHTATSFTYLFFHLPTCPAHLNQVAPLSSPALYRFLLGGVSWN